MMNKIDEYKKKINYDIWADVTDIPFGKETEVASRILRNLFQDSINQYHASNSKKRKKSGEDQ